MHTKLSLLATLGMASFLTGTLHAADGDKDQYWLFKPVPKEQMRPFFTDQTVFTITPYTVDAGHFQVEADAVDYLHDKTKVPGGEQKTSGWFFGWSTIKVGLCNRADFELGFGQLYGDITTTDTAAGTRTRSSGFGDMSLNLKVNLWGNDGGKTSLALMPFVDVPTSRGNNDWDGGLNVPFQVKLTDRLDLGLMTGVTLYENAARKMHPSFRNSVGLRGKIIDKLFGNADFVTNVSEETGAWDAFGNVSAGYQLLADLQLHAGLTFNIRNNSDLNPYIGFTWRY